MRKITKEAARALFEGYNYNGNNTNVKDGVLSLHGNAIAHVWTNEQGQTFLTIQDCGWQSNTTKERLNGILDTFGIRGGIFQKDFEWFFLNGQWGDENHTVEEWKTWKTFPLEEAK